MNWLKKGPELKLSELRVPDFLFNLYYDLKERHLLPVAIVLAIAVVVVPIALSQSTGAISTEAEAPVATPSTASGEASSLTVSRSASGLRDYRRRLRQARALDPFREQAETAEAAAAIEGSTEPGVVSAGSTAPEVVESAPEPVDVPIEPAPMPSYPSKPAPMPSEPSATATPRTKYATSSLDVRIVAVPQSDEGAARPTAAQPAATVRRGLPELTMLPSRSVPAAVFMGTSSDGKKALLLVSSDVESIFGDGRCLLGSQTCQLLALEVGIPETFVYGPQARTYRIEVLGINRKLTDEPHKASLGARKGTRSSGDEAAGGESGHEESASAGRVSSAQPR